MRNLRLVNLYLSEESIFSSGRPLTWGEHADLVEVSLTPRHLRLRPDLALCCESVLPLLPVSTAPADPGGLVGNYAWLLRDTLAQEGRLRADPPARGDEKGP